jgi:vacuolar-type H+-ATPase subunit H
MKEIDNMIKQAKSERDTKLKDVHSRMEKLMKEPLDKFEKDYKSGI